MTLLAALAQLGCVSTPNPQDTETDDTDTATDTATDPDTETATDTTDPGCTKDEDCDAAQWCDNGTCESCNTDAHCTASCVTCAAPTPFCSDDGTECIACKEDNDCNADKWCNAGACTACDDDDHCGTTCQVCTGTNTPTCDLSNDRCIECESDTDCPGPIGVCTPDGTCTCYADELTPKADCTSDTDCPNEDYVCAKDFDAPQHHACLRKCSDDTAKGNGLYCTSRTLKSIGTADVWTPNSTTCFAYYQHIVATTCNGGAFEEKCSGLDSYEDASCPSNIACTYPCTTAADCPDGETCPAGTCYKQP